MEFFAPQRMKQWLPGFFLGTVFLLRALCWWGDWVDDACITFRYADHWWQTGEMVFNPGERVEGLTDLGWALLLAPVTGDRLFVAKILGLLAGMGVVLVVDAWSRQRLSGPLRVLFWAALLLPPYLPFWSVQGLETPLVCLLVTLSWALPLPAAAAAAGAAVLFHPTSGLVSLLLLPSYGLQREKPRWSSVLLAVLALSVWGGLLLTLKAHWFGAVLPNTFAAKAGRYPWPNGQQYLLSFFEQSGLGILAGIGLLWGFWATIRRHPDLRVAWVGAAGLLTLLLINGDLFANFRLLLPFLPALIAAGLLGLQRLPARFHPIFFLFLISWAPLLYRDSIDRLALHPQILREKSSLRFDKQPGWGRGFRETWAWPTAWALTHATDKQTLAFTDIGLFSYLFPGPVVDLLGLTDPHLIPDSTIEPARAWLNIRKYLGTKTDFLLVDRSSDRWANLRMDDPTLWTQLAACGDTFVFRPAKKQETGAILPDAALEPRLERLMRLAPRQVAVQLAVARELLREKSGLSGRFMEELERTAGPVWEEELAQLRCSAEGRCEAGCGGQRSF